MKILDLRLRGIRRFRSDTSLRFHSKVTAVIGPNDAGKTTLLRAVASCLQATPLDGDDISRGMGPSEALMEVKLVAQGHETNFPSGTTYTFRRTHKYAAWAERLTPSQQEEVTHIVPQVVLFDRTQRQMPTAIARAALAGEPNTPGNPVPASWENMANSCQLNLREVAAAMLDPPRCQTLEDDWNERLRDIFRKRWIAESNIVPEIKLEQSVAYLHWKKGTRTRTPIEWGSDGIRTFLAMVLAIESSQRGDSKRPVVLLVDELEQSLHYDAQAAAVRMLREQSIASQVLYSTHSAGCLPGDLGRGLVAVRQLDSECSDISHKIWDSSSRNGRIPDVGVWPLLLAMGATTLGFVPTRRPVFVEGYTDMLLLPAAFRWASNESDLDLDFLPGLSHAATVHEASFARRATNAAYLVDGNRGGMAIKAKLESMGVPQSQIIVCEWHGLEDLISPDTLKEAYAALGLCVEDGFLRVDKGRSSAIAGSLKQQGLEAPGKETLAYAVQHLEDSGHSVWQTSRRSALQQVLARIRACLAQ